MWFFSGVSNCLVFLFAYFCVSVINFSNLSRVKNFSDYIFYMFTHVICLASSMFFLVPSLQEASCVSPGPLRSDTKMGLNMQGFFP